MKFKNLHEDTVTIVAKEGVLSARPGEFIELDEKTYNAVKTIYTKLELVVEKEPEPVKEPAKPAAKPKANKRCK